MRNEDSSGDPFATGGLDTRRDPTDYTSPTHDSRDDDSVDPPVSTTGGFGPSTGPNEWGTYEGDMPPPRNGGGSTPTRRPQGERRPTPRN